MTLGTVHHGFTCRITPRSAKSSFNGLTGLLARVIHILMKNCALAKSRISGEVVKSSSQSSEAIKADLGRRFRLCCLTPKPACPLMWAHYGDKHRGICLEFDALQQDLCSAIRVQYRDTYPAFPLDDGSDISPFYTKAAEWQYEEEYRLIAEEEGTAFQKQTLKTLNGFYQLQPNALKSVIVGALAPPAVRAKIKDMVARTAPHVLVRQAKCLPDRYQLAIEPPVAA
jgi:Protein of unknown function (DUF2971)